MRVLTLHEPWASLVSIGVKSIETRSTSAPSRLLGERIAIHAAKLQPVEGLQVGRWVCHRNRAYGAWMEMPDVVGSAHLLPLGAIVCTARLAASIPIVEGDKHPTWDHVAVQDSLWLCRGLVTTNVSSERPYGDFRAGRWAYLLEDVRPLDTPMPFRGGQGWSRSWSDG